MPTNRQHIFPLMEGDLGPRLATQCPQIQFGESLFWKLWVTLKWNVESWEAAMASPQRDLKIVFKWMKPVSHRTRERRGESSESKDKWGQGSQMMLGQLALFK